jgi:hypothetical protein
MDRVTLTKPALTRRARLDSSILIRPPLGLHEPDRRLSLGWLLSATPQDLLHLLVGVLGQVAEVCPVHGLPLEAEGVEAAPHEDAAGYAAAGEQDAVELPAASPGWCTAGG